MAVKYGKNECLNLIVHPYICTCGNCVWIAKCARDGSRLDAIVLQSQRSRAVPIQPDTHTYPAEFQRRYLHERVRVHCHQRSSPCVPNCFRCSSSQHTMYPPLIFLDPHLWERNPGLNNSSSLSKISIIHACRIGEDSLTLTILLVLALLSYSALLLLYLAPLIRNKRESECHNRKQSRERPGSIFGRK